MKISIFAAIFFGVTVINSEAVEPLFESISVGTNRTVSMVFNYGENATSFRLERAENPLLAFQPMAPGELVSTTFLPSNRVEFVVDQVALRTSKRVFRVKVVRNIPEPAPVEASLVSSDSSSDQIIDNSTIAPAKVEKLISLIEQENQGNDTIQIAPDVQIMESEDRLIASYM